MAGLTNQDVGTCNCPGGPSTTICSICAIAGLGPLKTTDANGTYNMTLWPGGPGGPLGNVGTGLPYWYVFVNSSAPSSTIASSVPLPPCTLVSGFVGVAYSGYCFNAGFAGPFTFSVTRFWGWYSCTGGDGYWTTYSTGLPGQGTAGATLSVPSGLSSCNPFVWSSALTTNGTPALPDPVGGTVIMSG